MNDWLELFSETLPSTDRVAEFLTVDGVGGIDLFLGTTRPEISPDGRALLALDYEAYPEMAIKEMHALAKRVREQYPVARLAILHRIGRVPVRQASVVIGVSTPHRAEAFAATKFLIDQLKVSVPIWKKEIWDAGDGTWVNRQ